MPELSIRRNDGTQLSLKAGELDALRKELQGELLLPSPYGGYEQARRIWNGLIDKRPALILACAGSRDAAAGVRFAARHGLLLSVRGGGHNVSGSALCEGGLVVDLSRLRSVQVDAVRRTVRVEGGALLGDLDRATQAQGLAVPVGLVSATGIGGLALHGGLGWLARRHGMTSDNLRSAQVVTADGELRTAAPGAEEDLLWALKGGGGAFGAVTSFEFQAYPVGPKVWLSMPMFPAEKAPEALRFFREFMSVAPEELTGIAIFWRAPSQAPIPEKAWGAEVIILAACYSGPPDRGEQVIRPLREFARPLADLSAEMPFSELQQFLDSDYPDGGLYYWKSLYLDELSDQAIGLLARQAARRPSPHSSLDLWGLGGELGRAPSTSTPLSGRDAPYLIGIEANWIQPAETEANIAWARETFRELEPLARGSYLNFAGFAEEGERLLRGAFAGNLERLRAIKKRLDPHGLFRDGLGLAAANAG
jgi:FAD/FMN-containing dehydrogenase